MSDATIKVWNTGDDYDKDLKFLMAIYENRLSPEEVQSHINQGRNVDIQEAADNSALHLAIDNKNIEVCRVLLENGANPNIEGFMGTTPSHRAFWTAMEHVKNFGPSLKRDADLNTALQLVTLLVSHGGDLTKEDRMGQSSLNMFLRSDKAVAELIAPYMGVSPKQIEESLLDLCFHKDKLPDPKGLALMGMHRYLGYPQAFCTLMKHYLDQQPQKLKLSAAELDAMAQNVR